MRGKIRLLEFLFPVETDSWLTFLRIGIGLEVTLYSLSLQKDWTNLLSGTGRKLADALLTLESHFVPRLGWVVPLAAQLGQRQPSLLNSFIGKAGMALGAAALASHFIKLDQR